MARVVGSMARVALLALSLALLSCGASAVDVSADAEAGAAPKAQAVALFSITITVDGKDHAIPLFEGDSPAAIARAFGAEHNVPVDGVNKIAQHIVQKSAAYLKRIFFHLPFYVEVSGKSQMMNLTVYEDSDAKELALMVARKFALPTSSADRLQVEIEGQVLQRAKLRVNVDLGGQRRTLLVKRGEDAQAAARRFGLEHGITSEGMANLAAHITAQLARIAERVKEREEGADKGL